MQSNTLFRELMKDAGSVDAAAAAKTSGSVSSSEDGAGVGSSGGTAASSPIRPPSKKGLSLLSSMSPQPQPAPVVSGGVTGGGLNADPKDLKAAPTVQHGLIEKEKRAKGSVGLGLIVDYARASGGISVVATILVTFAAIEAARLGASLWISKWANSEGDGNRTRLADAGGDDERFGPTGPSSWVFGGPTEGSNQKTSLYYIGIYGAISGGQAILTLANLVRHPCTVCAVCQRRLNNLAIFPFQ